MQYRKHEVDLIFLQETHSKKDSERQWKNEWGGEMIISDGSSNSCGVAILFKKGFDCTVFSKFDDPLGRYLTLKVVIKDKLYVLSAVAWGGAGGARAPPIIWQTQKNIY